MTPLRRSFFRVARVGLLALALLSIGLPARAEQTVTVTYSGPLSGLIPALIRQFPGVNIIPDASAAAKQLRNFTLQNATLGQTLDALRLAAHVRVFTKDGLITLTGDETTAGLGSDATTATFKLRYAAATDIADQLNKALGNRGGVIMADKRLNSVVFVGDPSYVPIVQSLIATFDMSDGLGTNITRSVSLNHMTTADAVKALTQAFGPNGSGAPLIFTEDHLNNAIVLQGPSGYTDRAVDLLTRLDAHVGRQVNVSVRVLDVTPQNDSKNIGIIFGGAQSGSGGSSTGSGSSGSATTTSPYEFFAPSIGSAVTVNATLDAMVQHGNASVLASPNTSVINGETANLIVGEQDPIVFNNGGVTSGNTYQLISTGVIFNFTPTQIGADGSMTLKIHAEYSQVISYTVVAGATYPRVGQRKAETVLHVHNGQSIILGGLTQETASTTESYVPVLGDIPLFGKLFHHVSTNHLKEQIIFEITPVILED
jgi:type II secretory pathway component GspD/PulD (secretin)